jgi:hypothetical protein
MRGRTFGVLSTALILGCTWVPLSAGGEKVRVASSEQIADCERLGKTTSSTATKVGFLRRSDFKVREELEALARNEAAAMGGDTVVPESPIDAGRRVFGVYDCKRR